MNTLENYEKAQLEILSSDKSYPSFNPGDTVKVHLKVKEGEKERIQVFEGVCIAKKNAGLNSSFTVRKISYGEGIERVLPLFSPQINKIELVKSGSVRRSKLYYLRKRSGKSARISEKNIFNKSDNNGDKVNNKEQQDANLKITDSVAKKNDDAENLKANQTKKSEDNKVDDKVDESKPELQKN
jgi:large subunit ribosomal protein L19